MLSLETARKLKEAGLAWEPQVGDWYYDLEENEPKIVCGEIDVRWIKLQLDTAIEKIYGVAVLWLPRLDQLLEEIERRGYRWALDKSVYNEGRYSCWVVNKYTCQCLWAGSPEEAAAQALLWILQGGENNGH